MDATLGRPLITDKVGFHARFPVPDDLHSSLSLQGKQDFVNRFVRARDKVETAYYAEKDLESTPGERTRRFFAAMMDPMRGRPIKDAEQFYETYGRLMRWAWLSISVGTYNPEIQTISDIAIRLLTAQANTVDLNWQPAIHQLASNGKRTGLIIEVGTGRGNSVVRLAQLFPKAKIISVTISPEQVRVSQSILRELNLKNVEIRLGDIFDRSVTNDLIGKADAVGAIEVTGHFPPEAKIEGIALLGELLKSGAPYSMFDSTLNKPMSPRMQRYFTNQSWHFGTTKMYLSALEDAGITPISYVDYTPDSIQTFVETTQVLRRNRHKLRDEFGVMMSQLWPEIPARVYIRAMRKVDYVHITGIKN